jgi:hypothetical protein
MPRLGELLVADGLVMPAHVERALAAQRRRGLRLGSILVDAELATPDAVARALGRQRTVPAALERHLAAHDPALAALLPGELARERLVLPLARSKDGGLVVAMRDPHDAELRAELVRRIGSSIVAAVACELVLRRHVYRVYPPVQRDVEDVEIDLESQAIPIIHDHELELGDVDLGPPTDILEPATVRAGPATGPSSRALELLDADTIRAGSLVSLDDAGVTRDHRQVVDTGTRRGPRLALGEVAPAMAQRPVSGQITPPASSSQPLPSSSQPLPAARQSTPTPRPTPPPIVFTPPHPASPDEPIELTAALTQIATATLRDTVGAAAIGALRGRATALILLAVRHGMAFGDTGFAPGLTAAAIEAITLPLNLPSVIKSAVDTARPYAGRPPVGSSIQDRLMKLLGKPGGLVVAPIVVGGRVASVMVAACDAAAAAEALRDDVATIASACGVAYARLR